ncbi:hypothetical protein [Lacrimispora sp.]|uniref:hypothetical protein n=1 Tax=Lacrimispora sp. TaxID=2719234 RepID=UPI00346152A0
MSNHSLNELLEKDLVVGCVCNSNGSNKTYYFENTPENIASFIMEHQESTNQLLLTSLSDRLILSTLGSSISHCPNQKLLQKVQKELCSLQKGEGSPAPLVVASEKEFQRLLYEEEQRVTAAELRML